MEFLYEYGLFFLKTATFVVALMIIIGIVVSAGMRQKTSGTGTIEVSKINDRFDEMRYALKRVIEDDDAVKKEQKAKEKQLKLDKKHAKNGQSKKKQMRPQTLSL